MMQTRKFILSALAVLFSSSGSIVTPGVAQSLSTQAGMHAKVVTLYAFSPSKVTAEVRESKSKEMDASLLTVKAHKDERSVILRRERENPDVVQFGGGESKDLFLFLSIGSMKRKARRPTFSSHCHPNQRSVILSERGPKRSSVWGW